LNKIGVCVYFILAPFDAVSNLIWFETRLMFSNLQKIFIVNFLESSFLDIKGSIVEAVIKV